MFTVAIAGNLTNDEGISRLVPEYLKQIEAYRTDTDDCEALCVAVCPPYVGEGWDELIADYPVIGYTGMTDSECNDRFDRHVNVDSPLRDTLGETLCDSADLLLAVWSEDVTQMDGAVWELLRIALRKRMPVLWISSRTGKSYWPEKTCYEPYRPKKLQDLCDSLFNARIEAEPCGKKEFPLLFIGRFFYKTYHRRFKASAKIVNAEEDVIMKDEYSLTGCFASAEPTRRSLLKRFRSFDQAAIAQSNRYIPALYWRSILPLITSLIVAVGFYGTNVLAGLIPLPLPAWGIIAGFAFLFHGLLNLYVFMLSRSAGVRDNRDKMIRNRRTAEMLRVLIHFVPFGIHLDLRVLCGDDRELYASLRRMIQEAEREPVNITRANRVEAFKNVDRMLSDQIAYHKLSLARYSRIADHLERWSKIIFYVGFCVIVLRAFLQFLMSIPGFPLPDLLLANSIQPRTFISSFANMMALLMPVWYAYFASKLSLGNYRFNCDNHQRMIELLEEERENISLLKDSVDDVPVEALQATGENLARIMIVKDMSLWTRHYRSTRIDHL